MSTINHQNRLSMVYNNNEVITGAGFTMQSNYILPLLARMVDEGIINNSAQTVVQTILQYKHTEENPFPSRDEVARMLGRTVSYVKKALSSIKNAGILLIEKVGRKNTYNFKPFFDLLEKFIVEFKDNKNPDIKIADLLNINVQKEEEQDFSWSEDYKDTGKNIVSEDVQEETVANQSQNHSLPQHILQVCEHNNIGSEGIKEVEKAYNEYGKDVQDEIFIDKIEQSATKNKFSQYFKKCIKNAYLNKEQPRQYNHNHNRKRSTEVIPDWFKDRHKKQEEAINKSVEDDIANASRDELVELKFLYESLLQYNNKGAEKSLKQVEARLNDFSLTSEQLKELTI